MNFWFLFLLSKVEIRISNFSFYSRNSRSEFHISLSTLEIRDQNLKFLFLLSKFEIRISNFSFYSRIYFFDSRQCLFGTLEGSWREEGMFVSPLLPLGWPWGSHGFVGSGAPGGPWPGGTFARSLPLHWSPGYLAFHFRWRILKKEFALLSCGPRSETHLAQRCSLLPIWVFWNNWLEYTGLPTYGIDLFCRQIRKGLRGVAPAQTVAALPVGGALTDDPLWSVVPPRPAQPKEVIWSAICWEGGLNRSAGRPQVDHLTGGQVCHGHLLVDHFSPLLDLSSKTPDQMN